MLSQYLIGSMRLIIERRSNMAKRSLLLPLPKFLALCITLFGALICTKVAVGAPSNTLEASREMDRTVTSDPAPSRVGIARVQSPAQKAVEEASSQTETTGSTPPSLPKPKLGGRIKKSGNVVDSTSSDKSDMRQPRGPSEIQNEDSLSAGNSKGKSSAKKNNSFD